MKGEEKQTDDVKTRDVSVLKSINHHRVNIVAVERIEFEKRKLRIEFARGEVEQMKNDKREDDQSACHHVPRGPACFHIIPVAVGFGPGAPTFHRQLDRE